MIPLNKVTITHLILTNDSLAYPDYHHSYNVEVDVLERNLATGL